MAIPIEAAPALRCGCGQDFQEAGDFIKHFGKCWGHGIKPKTKKRGVSAADRRRLHEWNQGKGKRA